MDHVDQSANARKPIYSERMASLLAASKANWTRLVSAENNCTGIGKPLDRWLDTFALLLVNIFGAIVLAHLLILIYMHENNFYAYDFVSSAGIALELMYIQFEIIGLMFAMLLTGSIPFGLYALKRHRRLAAKRTNISSESTESLIHESRWVLLLKFGAAATLILNIAIVGKLFNWTLPSETDQSLLTCFLFALYVSAFVSVVYLLDGPEPKWKKSAMGFALLFALSIVFSERSAGLVTTALQRARLGGNILVTLDYSAPRQVSKGSLDEEILRTRKLRGETVSNPSVATAESMIRSGERAFECISPAQGYLILDSPTHLYVQVMADPCDATDARSLNRSNPLFTQVIEKSKLRQYRLYRNPI